MATYSSDRAFTDMVHNTLALPKIYAPLNWQPYVLSAKKATEIDMFKGIDYVFTNDGNAGAPHYTITCPGLHDPTSLTKINNGTPVTTSAKLSYGSNHGIGIAGGP